MKTDNRYNKPAPLSLHVSQWLRFFFPRGVVKSRPPENLGMGLRIVLELECGHSFHIKPPCVPAWWFCAACAHAWVKRRRPEEA
jgi:hypothetical protein